MFNRNISITNNENILDHLLSLNEKVYAPLFICKDYIKFRYIDKIIDEYRKCLIKRQIHLFVIPILIRANIFKVLYSILMNI